MSRFRVTSLLALTLVAAAAPLHAQGGLLKRIKAKAQQKLEKKIDSTADTLTSKALNKATCLITNSDCIHKAVAQGQAVVIVGPDGRPVSSADSAQAIVAAGGVVPAGSVPGAAGGAAASAPAAAAGPTSIAAYQNYDFVPGDSIVFDDDFRSDQDGEFPAHWRLLKGQAVVNQVQGEPAFALTEGNYVRVTPRIKTPSYLADPFTIEFDFYAEPGGNMPVLELEQGDKEGAIYFGRSDGEVSSGGFEAQGADASGSYPGHGGFSGKWHHAALVFKHGQIKAYEDQYRVLVLPDVGTFAPTSIQFAGIGAPDHPIIIANVRLANGGGMNLIDKLTKDGRIVTHGILFDVNKSEVKPQSMGTIRQIVTMLNANAALKVEIDGHTDSDGDAAANMTLSQARADAVKALLVQQGIDASRLTTKGYGATKPIASNDTPEGKANNRRVEFVKQ